jgi:AraC-like DNA-binding protein
MNKITPLSSFKYVVILSAAMVLVTFTVGISYYMTVYNMETIQEEANLRSILQLKNVIDERLNKINYIVNNLGTYYQTSYILNMSFEWENANPSDIMTAKDYMEYINALQFSTDLVAQISIYSKKSDHVFTSKGIKSFSQWYSDSFSHSDITEETWMKNINSLVPQKLQEERTYYDNSIPVSVIPYVQKLPLGSRKQTAGYICLLLKKKSLLGSEAQNYDYFYITDASNNIVTKLGRNFRDTDIISIPSDKDQGYFSCDLDNNRQIVTYAHSADNLTYVALTSYRTVMKNVRYFKNLFVTMIIVSIAFCILSVIMSIFKIQRPYKRLISDNYHLARQIRQQENEFKTAILSRLVSGNVGNYDETMATLNSLNMSANNKNYCAVKLIIEDEHISDFYAQRKADNYLAAKTHIRNLADPGNKYILDTGIDSLTIIFETGKEEIDSCRQQILDLVCMIQKQLRDYGISIFAGGGNFCDNITNIHTSYLEASFALKNAMPKEADGVLWYDKQDFVPIFFYPPEIEQKILLNVRCHDSDVVEEILEELYRENFLKLKISDSAAEMFLLKLLSTLLQAFNENSCQKDDLHQQIMAFTFTLQSRQQSYHTSFTALRKFFLDICFLVKESLNLRALEMQNSILDFINDHFCDQQMSLAYVGRAFHLSESHLSVTFKEQNGVNFSTFVENKRLEKACELLQNRKKTIDEIAFAVGYTSSHSFRRAFKRKYGVSPANFQTKEIYES